MPHLPVIRRPLVLLVSMLLAAFGGWTPARSAIGDLGWKLTRGNINELIILSPDPNAFGFSAVLDGVFVFSGKVYVGAANLGPPPASVFDNGTYDPVADVSSVRGATLQGGYSGLNRIEGITATCDVWWSGPPYRYASQNALPTQEYMHCVGRVSNGPSVGAYGVRDISLGLAGGGSCTHQCGSVFSDGGGYQGFKSP